MVEVNITTKTDISAKGCSIIDGQIVDNDGVIINIIEILEKAYGDAPFDLKSTKSIKESIEIENL